MRISATATPSPRSRRIPSQHQVRHDRLHRNITHDHPAAWFGQIPRILRGITPFLQAEFCYTATIMAGRGKDGISGQVSLFLNAILWHFPHKSLTLFCHCSFCCGHLGWLGFLPIAFMVIFHPPQDSTINCNTVDFEWVGWHWRFLLLEMFCGCTKMGVRRELGMISVVCRGKESGGGGWQTGQKCFRIHDNESLSFRIWISRRPAIKIMNFNKRVYWNYSFEPNFHWLK